MFSRHHDFPRLCQSALSGGDEDWDRLFKALKKEALSVLQKNEDSAKAEDAASEVLTELWKKGGAKKVAEMSKRTARRYLRAIFYRKFRALDSKNSSPLVIEPAEPDATPLKDLTEAIRQGLPDEKKLLVNGIRWGFNRKELSRFLYGTPKKTRAVNRAMIDLKEIINRRRRLEEDGEL